MPQKRSGFLVITCGPGMMPWIVMAPTIRAMTAFGGMPSVRSGMKDVCAPALLAASGPATPSIAPAPEPARVLGDLLLDRIRREGTQHRAVAGQDAEDRADCRSAQDRQVGLPEILPVRQQAADRLMDDVARLRMVKIAQDLGNAEDAHGQHREIDAVRQEGQAERQPLLPGLQVGSDGGEQHAQHDHGDGLQDRAPRQDHGEDEAHHHEGKILRRSEDQRELGQRARRAPQ